MATYSEFQNVIVRSGALTLGNPDYLGPVTTLSAATPAASRTYTLPDIGASANVRLGVESVQVVTSATTLQAANSGQTIHVSNPGSAYTITLPPLSSGVNFKFVVVNTLSNPVTLTAGQAIIFGSLLSSDGTAVPSGAISGKTNIIWGTGAKIGDRLDIYGTSNGNWVVLAVTALNTSLTSS